MPNKKDDSFEFLVPPDQATSSRPRTADSVPPDHLAVEKPARQRRPIETTGRISSLPPREEFPFLISEHAFDASSLDSTQAQRDPTAQCLSFNKNDLAFVHYAHGSGWTDVTLVKNGERGWVPIDYFIGYSDARAIPLLAAVAAFLANPKSQKVMRFQSPLNQESSSLQSSSTRFVSGYTFSEPTINEIISGTKLLLDKTNVLSRDSQLVQEFPSVAASRKALLTELAHIVRKAQVHKNSTEDYVIEKLVRSCYRLLSHTLALLRTVDEPDVKQFFIAMRRKNSQSSRVSRTSSHGSSGSTRDAALPQIQAFSPDSSGTSINTSGSILSSNGNSSIGTAGLYRVKSFNDHETAPTPIERLQEVVDAFVYYLKGFLNPEQNLLRDPVDPNSSPEILALTRHCMLACRELLPVLDLGPPTAIDETRDELLEEIRKLVSSARSVVASLPPAPASLLTVASQSMILSASKCLDLCLHSARECYIYLQGHPHLELASDWTYPAFNVGDHVNLLEKRESGKSIRDESELKISRLRQSRNENLLKDRPLSQLSSVASPHRAPSPHVPDTSIDSNTSEIFRAAPTAVSVSSNKQNESNADDSYKEGDSKDDSQIDESNTNELVVVNGKVRGGSLTSIVEWLTGPLSASLEMEIRIFLLCFRLFTTAKDLVIELGSVEQTTGVKHMANMWVQSFWESSDNVLGSIAPFLDIRILNARESLIKSARSPKLVRQVVDLPLNPHPKSYTESVTSRSASSSSQNVSTATLPLLRNNSIGQQFSASSAHAFAQTFRDFSIGGRRISRQNDDFRSSSIGKNGANNASMGSEIAEYLLDCVSTDIAQQLTLMWSELLHKIRPSELLDQRFSSSKRSQGLAPHVTQFIQISNHLSSLVSDTILGPVLSGKQRTRVLKQWIRIADDMYALGNLNGVVAIVAVLQSTSISRLHRVWESLSTKYHIILDRLRPLASLARNFGDYRRELQQRYGSPCVPYLGCLLNDLIFTEEGNPKTLKKTGGINFERYMRLGRLIAAFQPFQSSVYDITPDPSLQVWLRKQMASSHSRESRDSEDLWRRSLLIQPESD